MAKLKWQVKESLLLPATCHSILALILAMQCRIHLILGLATVLVPDHLVIVNPTQYEWYTGSQGWGLY